MQLPAASRAAPRLLAPSPVRTTWLRLALGLLVPLAGCMKLGGIAMGLAEVAVATVVDHAQRRAHDSSPRVQREVRPAEIALTAPRDRPSTEPIVIRVRAHATEDYLVQTPQAEERFREDLALVSQYTAGWGVAFELASFQRWRCSSGALATDRLLHDLAVEDPGDGAELVVGLIGRIGAVPDGAMDRIGTAVFLGKHVLLRDRLADAEATVASEMPDATREVRQSVGLDVYRHEMVTLFLHEWAHTLGAVHSLDERSIMAGAYSKRVGDFDRINRRILETALRWMAPGATDRSRAALARALRAIVERSPPDEIPSEERRRAVELLDAIDR